MKLSEVIECSALGAAVGALAFGVSIMMFAALKSIAKTNIEKKSEQGKVEYVTPANFECAGCAVELSEIFCTDSLPLPNSWLNYSSSKPKPLCLVAKVTAYCPCEKCCGNHADGKTATGTNAYSPGIAADPSRIPYGMDLNIPGYGIAKVDDTGKAMRDADEIHIDVRFPSHQQALEWGVRQCYIWIPRNDWPKLVQNVQKTQEKTTANSLKKAKEP